MSEKPVSYADAPEPAADPADPADPFFDAYRRELHAYAHPAAKEATIEVALHAIRGQSKEVFHVIEDLTMAGISVGVEVGMKLALRDGSAGIEKWIRTTVGEEAAGLSGEVDKMVDVLTAAWSERGAPKG